MLADWIKIFHPVKKLSILVDILSGQVNVNFMFSQIGMNLIRDFNFNETWYLINIFWL